MQESWWKVPNIAHIVERLNENYAQSPLTPEQRATLGKTMHEYDADLVYAEHWRPLFADIESGKIKLGAPAEQSLNRAQRRAKK
jgi:hypothetical protein